MIVRMDAGFPEPGLLEGLESRGVPYPENLNRKIDKGRVLWYKWFAQNNLKNHRNITVIYLSVDLSRLTVRSAVRLHGTRFAPVRSGWPA